MCDPRQLPPRANHRQPRPHTMLVMLSGMAACRSGQSPSGSSMHATGHRSPLLNSTTGFPSSPPRPWQPYVPKATSSSLLPPGGRGKAPPSSLQLRGFLAACLGGSEAKKGGGAGWRWGRETPPMSPNPRATRGPHSWSLRGSNKVAVETGH